jgi:hypothetical protein
MFIGSWSKLFFLCRRICLSIECLSRILLADFPAGHVPHELRSRGGGDDIEEDSDDEDGSDGFDGSDGHKSEKSRAWAELEKLGEGR